MMMSYKITDVEGIGEQYVQRLGAAGVLTTEILLRRCATAEGRATVAAELEVPPEVVLEWVRLADLMRIKGIGGEYAELLKAAGVHSVMELGSREAAHLAEAVAAANFTRKLARRLPSLPTTTRWIEEARKLDPIVNC